MNFASTRSRTRWSVATRLFAAHVASVVVLSAVFFGLLWLDARSDADTDAARLSLAVATTLARDPFVIESVQAADPTALLQPYAERVMDEARIDFVTIMDTDGIRWTHRNVSEIGERFLGTRTEGLAGRSLTETYTGTLGPSVRGVVPVFAASGEVVALVSAGVTVSNVVATILPRLPWVISASVIVVLIGSLAAYAGRRYLARLTGSLAPDDLGRMLAYYESVLHSMHEGLVLADRDRRLVLYNDEASDLLGLPPARSGAGSIAIDDLDLPPSIAALLTSGQRAVEESHAAGARVLVVNQERTAAPGTAGGDGGTVMTMRDRTDVTRLSGELEAVTTLTRALRAQTHEFANRLHTIASLLELDRRQDAIDFIADEMRVSQSLADDLMQGVGNPALAALLLGKSAQAAERGIDFSLESTGSLDPHAVSSSDLVSLLGNLIDNALDAVGGADDTTESGAAGSRWVHVRIDAVGDLVLEVADSGPGIPTELADRIFEGGVSSKGVSDGERGFGLGIVARIAESHGGSVHVASSGDTTFTVRLPTRVTS